MDKAEFVLHVRGTANVARHFKGVASITRKLADDVRPFDAALAVLYEKMAKSYEDVMQHVLTAMEDA